MRGALKFLDKSCLCNILALFQFLQGLDSGFDVVMGPLYVPIYTDLVNVIKKGTCLPFFFSSPQLGNINYQLES